MDELEEANINLKSLQKSVVGLASAVALNGLSSTVPPYSLPALFTAVCTGIISGYWQHQESLDKYKKDELPSSIALRESIIDGITALVHDSITTFSQGADDAAMDFLKGIVDFLNFVGIIKVNLTDGQKDKNYVELMVEVIRDWFDISLIGLRGTRKADDIVSLKDDDKPIYSDDDNDKILLEHSKLKVYAGTGNDTIFSLDNTHDNYVYAGFGKDYMVIAGKKHIVHGGADDDRIVLQGIDGEDVSDEVTEGHYIYGDEGNDYIELRNKASNNTIRGGEGADVINLSSSQNNVIVYASGDGEQQKKGMNPGNGPDTIYGYSESNTIRIYSDDDFSTLTNFNSDDATIKLAIITLW